MNRLRRPSKHFLHTGHGVGVIETALSMEVMMADWLIQVKVKRPETIQMADGSIEIRWRRRI